jgi:hypothetical protein
MGIVLLAGCVVAVIAAIYYVWSWRDTKVHGGITAARRRRTMKSGRIAEATVLSSEILPGATLDANTTARSIVYEVSAPDGPKFRAKAIEVFGWGSDDLANPVEVGSTVRVKFDDSHEVVVLLHENSRNAKKRAEEQRHAREDALLGK